jgi:hypothetical protein
MGLRFELEFGLFINTAITLEMEMGMDVLVAKGTHERFGAEYQPF